MKRKPGRPKLSAAEKAKRAAERQKGTWQSSKPKLSTNIQATDLRAMVTYGTELINLRNRFEQLEKILQDMVTKFNINVPKLGQELKTQGSAIQQIQKEMANFFSSHSVGGYSNGVTSETEVLTEKTESN